MSAIRIGLSDGGGVSMTRTGSSAGTLPSVVSWSSAVTPTSALPSDAATSITAPSGSTMLSPSREDCPVGGEHQVVGVVGVGGPGVADRGDVDLERRCPAGSAAARSGQRRNGRSSPTWTGTVRIAVRPSGSSTRLPVVTSNDTAARTLVVLRRLDAEGVVAGDRGADRTQRARPDPVLQRERDRAAGRVLDVVVEVEPRPPRRGRPRSGRPPRRTAGRWSAGGT